MECRPPGSSVHGILQASILERVAIPFYRASSWPRDETRTSASAGGFFTNEPPGKPTLHSYMHITLVCACSVCVFVYVCVCSPAQCRFQDVFRGAEEVKINSFFYSFLLNFLTQRGAIWLVYTWYESDAQRWTAWFPVTHLESEKQTTLPQSKCQSDLFSLLKTVPHDRSFFLDGSLAQPLLRLPLNRLWQGWVLSTIISFSEFQTTLQVEESSLELRKS